MCSPFQTDSSIWVALKCQIAVLNNNWWEVDEQSSGKHLCYCVCVCVCVCGQVAVLSRVCCSQQKSKTTVSVFWIPFRWKRTEKALITSNSRLYWVFLHTGWPETQKISFSDKKDSCCDAKLSTRSEKKVPSLIQSFTLRVFPKSCSDGHSSMPR